MKGKSENEVIQSCPTLRDPMVCSLPSSSVHGIFQARVLEWGAIECGNSFDLEDFLSIVLSQVCSIVCLMNEYFSKRILCSQIIWETLGYSLIIFSSGLFRAFKTLMCFLSFNLRMNFPN